jgi:hypothetical protein
MDNDDKRKKLLLESIKKAQDRLKLQQEVYCEKVNAPPLDKDTAMAKKENMSWPDLKALLDIDYYPVDREALERYLVDPSQCELEEFRINNIEDSDIRFAVYFLNEISLHTQRIKSHAEFYYLFGALDEGEELIENILTYSQCIEIYKRIDDHTELIAYQNSNHLQIQKSLIELIMILEFSEIVDDVPAVNDCKPPLTDEEMYETMKEIYKILDIKSSTNLDKFMSNKRA